MNLFKLFKRHRSGTSDIPTFHDLSPEAYFDAWRIFSIKNEATGEAAIVRLRMAQPARPDLHEFKTAIVINWPYESESVKPADEINQQQIDFETALESLSTHNDNSELMQVKTGLGSKEWVYYARNQEKFMELFNTLLAGHPPYPLRIEFYEDPEWKIWAETVFDLRAKGQGADLSAEH